MNIENEKLAEMKDMLDMLKNTTSIIKMLQGNIEMGTDGADLEDVSNSLFLVWERQVEYINTLESNLVIE